MGAHRVSFRVYYEDTDAGGIVYHARYLGFSERARAEALRSLGMPVGELRAQENLAFVVRHMDVRYHTPLRLDELFEVETSLLEMGGARLKLEQNVSNSAQGGKRAAVLTVELVCLRADTMAPVRIPPHYRDLLRQIMR